MLKIIPRSRALRIGLAAAGLLCVSILLGAQTSGRSWRDADRSSAGIAPTPEDEPEALVHVYGARAWSWRGYFAVHTWIATKEKSGDHYMTYQVTGWGLRRRGTSVSIEESVPDRRWYDAEPYLIEELKGARAERAIPKIRAAADTYQNAQTYRAWPGPNSNTFTSHIIRSVAELGVELPPHAIGKDWIGDGDLFGRSESGTGVQISILGVLGATVGVAEGVEVNLLGLNFGLDVWRPAFKLPIVGRVGFKDAPVFE